MATLNAPKRTATVLSGCSFGTKCTACGDHLSYDIGCRLSDARARLSTIFGVVALGWLVKNEGESALNKQQDIFEAVPPHYTDHYIMKRTASAVWQGDLKKGQGTLSTQSGVLNKTQYSFATRFENGIGTNPEELIAAAHAGCFTMALSAFLGNAGFTAEELSTRATLTLEQVEGNWTITTIHLDLSGRVPGIDAAKFDEIADQAKAGCPVSRVLKADITLTKKLET